jgi:hypothetical protein
MNANQDGAAQASFALILNESLGIIGNPGLSRRDRVLAARVAAVMLASTPQVETWAGDVLGAIESGLSDDDVWRPLLRALIRRLGDEQLATRLERLLKVAVAGRHPGARRYLIRHLLRNPTLAESVEDVWVENAVVRELTSDDGQHAAARLIDVWTAARGFGAPWLSRTVEAWPSVLASAHLVPETSRRLLMQAPSPGGWLALASRVSEQECPMAFSVVELDRHVGRAIRTLQQAHGEAPRAELRRVLRDWMDDLGVIPP